MLMQAPRLPLQGYIWGGFIGFIETHRASMGCMALHRGIQVKR